MGKRALLTAFATRVPNQLVEAMEEVRQQTQRYDGDAFRAVGLAYVAFAPAKPSFFRTMRREETIHSPDGGYHAATRRLVYCIQEGFVQTLEDEDPETFSAQEPLA